MVLVSEFPLSLFIRPVTLDTVKEFRALGDTPEFARGQRNKVSEESLENRYDCLVRLLSSVIVLSRLDPGIWLYRSMKASSFTNAPVGYRTFRFVSDYLVTRGLLSKVVGIRTRDKSLATSFSLTSKLIEVCENAGLTAHALPRLFSLDSLVRSRYPSTRDRGKKIRGKPVPMETLKTCDDYEDQCRIVSGINQYLLEHKLEGVPFNGLYRSFSNFEDRQPALKDGGRLYAEGGSYQTLGSDLRLHLKIDGEPVAEIDITASHLTLLCAVARMLDGGAFTENDPYDLGQTQEDPYAIQGIPRNVVKQWVVAYSSELKPLTRWSPESRKRLAEEGIDTGNYKVREVGQAITSRYPFIKTLTSASANWGYFQRREADALIMAIRRLNQEHDQPAYPVHDSLIVKRSAVTLASRIMQESFTRGIGITPRFKVTSAIPL
jgi:hypothetical protein